MDPPDEELPSRANQSRFHERQLAHFTDGSAENFVFVSFLVGLNSPKFERPFPEASHLVIEVWDNWFLSVRVFRSGEEIPIQGKELVALEMFNTILDTHESLEIQRPNWSIW